MPHQCTNCGRTFADGSKEMLSGCPDCGGNKFQFAPTATAAADSSAEADGSVAVDAGTTPDSSGSAPDSDGVATRAAETVRNLMSSGSADDSRSESPNRQQPVDSEAAADSAGSWPASGTAETADSATTADDEAPEGEFDEWPETARRPADRSGSSADRDAAADADDTATDAEWPDQSPDGSSEPVPGPTTTFADDENTAQADARSEVVPTDELPAHDGDEPTRPTGTADAVEPSTGTTPADASPPAAGADDDSQMGADPAADPPAGTGDDSDHDPPDHGQVVQEPSGQRPSIEELRAELNEQFESIKIVRPGQYELNLMELYNREEYIISLQEDGRYVIDVPDSWRDGDEAE